MKQKEIVKEIRSREKKEKEVLFCLPFLSVSLRQSHAQWFCPTAKLCSLSVISVDQPVEEERKKKIEGKRTALQSRSSTSNPTG